MVNKYNLPKKLYKVRVPLIATYSEEEMELFGIPMDEIDGIAKDTSEAMTTVMINLDTMIDIYSAGFPIKLVNNNEIDILFKSLEQYLSGSSHEEKHSLNRLEVIDDRLDEIDKFAQEMFGYNKATIVKKSINARNSFGLNVGLMNDGFTNTAPQPVRRGRAVGMMASYKDDPVVEPITGTSENRVYGNIFANAPEIDISKVTRTSTRRKRRGISMKDLEDKE